MNLKAHKTDMQRYNIQVVDKCLDLLDLLGKHPGGLSLVELSQMMSLPKSSVFRYLVTFENHGYVERIGDEERFRLGIKLFELGQIVYKNLDIRELALPSMKALLEAFQETVNLAVMDNTEVVYIEMLESSQALRMAARRGSRDKVHLTALGKSMLAFMEAWEVDKLLSMIEFTRSTPRSIQDAETLKKELAVVKERGFALDQEENEEGVCCAGAPIFNHQGKPIAAISISGPRYRISDERLLNIGKEIAWHTRYISRKLGYEPNLHQEPKLHQEEP